MVIYVNYFIIINSSGQKNYKKKILELNKKKKYNNFFNIRIVWLYGTQNINWRHNCVNISGFFINFNFVLQLKK